MIRLGALGDVLRTLPAVSSLRVGYPRAHITWLVERPARGALEGLPWIDEVLEFPRQALSMQLAHGRIRALLHSMWGVRAELRKRQFDLAVDFHGILKSGILAWLSGARVRASFAPAASRELSWLFANRRAPLGRAPVSRFERNAALVRYLGVSAPAAEFPLPLVAAAESHVDRLLAGAEPMVAIHPGSSASTIHKRYSPLSYGQVARGLLETAGVRSIVTYGPSAEERRLAETVVRAARGAAVLAPATAGIAELAALLARCRVFVGGDSGPLHAASLVGTPVVQILGPTHAIENAPHPGTPSRTLRVPLECSPCRRGCAAAPCMRVIPPRWVVDAARELLAEAKGRGSARGA